ncbi:MAG TPA: type II toxin-antitoxin system HipA family toxin [Gemmatimonadaceae bacterium]|jgi:serine/threonine-protein kinase HipA|nr:type II toxin-antitoxin system HipA family toxin [Gemmatimonadaceae bacterium]
MTTVAAVHLWGRRIGAVALEDGQATAAFQYEPAFARSGIQLSPIVMPLANMVYTFPALPVISFHGLPGLLADALPDKFGNALIDVWLATQGRNPDSFNAVERLLYTGARGMGALEFKPAIGPNARTAQTLDIDALVTLASEVLTHHANLEASLIAGHEQETLQDILRVGTSAGGARAKAVIAWNPSTNAVRSGQVPASPGFGSWIIKFDGVSGNRDKDLEDPKGFGAIEYAYAQMATAAGITMSDCHLLEENGRRHFMTRRFDRLDGGEKLHMQSLAALAHYDFNQAGAHSYEQAIGVIRALGLSMDAIEQQFRRMAFNIVARNQDDHVKNIAFLMDKLGHWTLSPAFDLTYSYNPSGAWTSQHQMSMNGKRDQFTVEDFVAVANTAGMKRGRGKAILREVQTVVSEWPTFAARVGVMDRWTEQINRTLRLRIPSK